jgi:hypothetical protein
VAPVGADDEPGVLAHRPAAALVAAHAGDAPVLLEQLVDREALAHLGAGPAGGVDEDLIEDRPARAVERVDTVVDGEAAVEHGGTGVEAHLARGGRAGRDHVIEQAPAREPGDPRELNLVGGERVAREGGAVDDEHVEAAAGEEHGGRGPGDPGADDDDVVHGRRSVAFERPARIGAGTQPAQVRYPGQPCPCATAQAAAVARAVRPDAPSFA